MRPEFDKFLTHLRTRYARDTVDGKRWQLMSFGKWLDRTKRTVDRLSRGDLEGFLRVLPCCWEHKHNTATTLRQFYEFHGINPNPAGDLRINGRRGRRLIRLPSAAKIAGVIERITSADALVELRDRLMVELAYGSALRRGELLRLNVEDVNTSEGTAFVTGKGDKSRVVPLTTATRTLLREYLSIRKNARGPLLTNTQTGRRLSPHHISKLFRTRTGMKTHLFRHACATHLLQNGCNLRVVQELLGHAKIDTTGVYTHLDTTDVRASLTHAHPRSARSV